MLLGKEKEEARKWGKEKKEKRTAWYLQECKDPLDRFAEIKGLKNLINLP